MPPEPEIASTARGTVLFAYGSLVNRASAELTLGRKIGAMERATVRGWRRRWNLLRDNAYCEKTFALEDGSIPDWILSLNAEPTGDRDDLVNGVLIEIGADDLVALDGREIRYRRIDVSAEPQIAAVTYTATPRHTARATPPGALILDPYLDAVEQGFRDLGDDQLETFRATTGEPPVPVVSCRLVRHDPSGSSPVPRW